MKTIKSISIFLFLVVFSACETESQKQKTTAEEAVKALKAIYSVTFQSALARDFSSDTYSKRIEEAKTPVNLAKSTLPDGELKKEIASAMVCFQDAENLMNGKVTSPDGKNIGAKYFNRELEASMLTYDNDFKARADIVLAIWAKAKEHVEKASKLSEKQ